jgi:hypothetical protein
MFPLGNKIKKSVPDAQNNLIKILPITAAM